MFLEVVVGEVEKFAYFVVWNVQPVLGIDDSFVEFLLETDIDYQTFFTLSRTEDSNYFFFFC